MVLSNDVVRLVSASIYRKVVTIVTEVDA